MYNMLHMCLLDAPQEPTGRLAKTTLVSCEIRGVPVFCSNIMIMREVSGTIYEAEVFVVLTEMLNPYQSFSHVSTNYYTLRLTDADADML